jgi:hypothetical protein
MKILFVQRPAGKLDHAMFFAYCYREPEFWRKMNTNNNKMKTMWKYDKYESKM